ncbi:MAG: NYN domain-containing protein [Nitrospinae bacterium]|nr:NYN domain-containing protein [Nitrospinota bacterium]
MKKKAAFFFDGQNLFHCAKEAFGYEFPNYDPLKLAEKICELKDWSLGGVRFYTGVPEEKDHYFMHYFWSQKIRRMKRQGLITFTRPIRHGKEKGIDIRIALDMVRMARHDNFDVVVVFSQDQDLSEAVDEVKDIARLNGKPIHIASVYPLSGGSKNRRGINHTEWIPVDKTIYDACIDHNEYRPSPKPK